MATRILQTSVEQHEEQPMVFLGAICNATLPRFTFLVAVNTKQNCSKLNVQIIKTTNVNSMLSRTSFSSKRVNNSVMSEAIPIKTNKSCDSSFLEMFPLGSSQRPIIIKYNNNCSIITTQVSGSRCIDIFTCVNRRIRKYNIRHKYKMSFYLKNLIIFKCKVCEQFFIYNKASSS